MKKSESSGAQVFSTIAGQALALRLLGGVYSEPVAGSLGLVGTCELQLNYYFIRVVH